jgi:hypothetical protein
MNQERSLLTLQFQQLLSALRQLWLLKQLESLAQTSLNKQIPEPHRLQHVQEQQETSQKPTHTKRAATVRAS